MAVDVGSSALGLELDRILGGPGSPFYQMDIVVNAGDRILAPLQVVRRDVARDYKTTYMDDHSVTLQFGAGTAIFDIGPYQDDLTITISRRVLSGTDSKTDNPKTTVRTFTAYLTDDLPRGPEIASAPQFADRETANRSKTLNLTFVLEEVVMTQLRKMSIGTIVRKCSPWEVLKTFLANALDSIRVGVDSKIDTFEMVKASNITPRDHIPIHDGTPLIDLPDLLQNERGGIYSSGLGFYVQGAGVYVWPLYDTSRQRLQSAKRVLQVFLSPSQSTAGIDKTWLFDGRILTVWASGIPKLLNDSLDILNTEGNAVRFSDADKLLGGMGVKAGNKFTMNRSENNSEFATTTVGNGANYAVNAKVGFSSNPYVETSRMARRQGQFMVIPWDRSNPDLLIPSMMVEVYYDAGGAIKIMSGVLTGNTSADILQGRGPTERVFASKTSLEVFLDRNDPDFQAYLERGGTVSGTPQIDLL